MRAFWLYLRCVVANRYTNLAVATVALALVLLYPASLSGSKEYLLFCIMMSAIGFIVFIAAGAAADTYATYRDFVASFEHGTPLGFVIPSFARHQVRAGLELACKDHNIQIWRSVHQQ